MSSRCRPSHGARLPIATALLLGLGTTLAAAQSTELQRIMTVTSEGPDWQIVKIEDPDTIDPVTRAVSAGEVTELYVVRGVGGIEASPMPEGQKAELINLSIATAEEIEKEGLEGIYKDRVFIVHKEIVDRFWKQGEVPDRFRGFAHSRCAGWAGLVDESFDPQIPLQGTLPIQRDTARAEIGFSTTLETDFRATIRYRVHTTLCIPSSIEFETFDLTADLRLRNGTSTLELETEQSWSQTYQKQIANPRFWVLAFAIPPIPVTINFKLPTKIGVNLETTAAAATTVEMPFNGHFGFTYSCDNSGCSGTKIGDFDADNPLHDATGSLEVNLKAEPFFDSRVRANLYTDRVFYFEVGLRAGLKNWLWGYAGNRCGDADGDNSPEWVQGAFFDSVFDFQVPWGYGGVFGEDEQIESVWRRSVYFQDLLPPGTPNNAIAPTIDGPAWVQQGWPASYQVAMRPCYPLADDLRLQLEGGNSGQPSASFPYDPASGVPVTTEHVFADINNQALRAINVGDTIGRTIGSYSAQNVWVEPQDVGNGGKPDGPAGPCDPMCPPPIIHDFDVFLDRSGTFADAYVEAQWSLGWDIDPTYTPPAAPATRVEVVSYYVDHNGDLADVGSDLIRLAQYWPRDLANFRRFSGDVLVTDFETITGHAVPVICLKVDMDSSHVMVPYDLVSMKCVDLQGSVTDILSHIVVQASVEAGSDDVEVSWTDDSSEPNRFALYRSLDGGSFELLSENLASLSYVDYNVDPGTYVYGVLSNGREYFSNAVTLEAAPPQRPVITWSEPRFGGTAISRNPDNRYIEVYAYDSSGVAWNDNWEAQFTFEDPAGPYWYFMVAHGNSYRRTFWKDIKHRKPPVTSISILPPGWHTIHFRFQNPDDWRDVIVSPGYRFYKPDYNLRARSDECPPSWKLIWDDEGFEEYEVAYRRGSTDLSIGFVTGTELDLPPSSGRHYAIRGRGQPWWSNVVLNPCAYTGITSFTASDHILEHVLLEWRGPRDVEVWRSDRLEAGPEGADLVATVHTSGLDWEYRDVNAPTDVPLYYWLREVGSTDFSAVATGFRPSIIQLDLPDLSPLNLSVSLVATGELRASFDLHNFGAGDAGAFTYDLWLSADPVLDAGDYLHQSVGVLTGLASGGQMLEVSPGILVPGHLQGRTVYVFAVADNPDDVEEEDEANNQAVTSVYVPSSEF